MALLTAQDRLVDHSLSDFGPDAAPYVLKTINLLMLKLLQHAPVEKTLTALFGLLSRRRSPPAPPQIAELLVKCISKLEKTVKDWAADLQLAPVLRSMDSLYAALDADLSASPTASKMSAAADSMLRALAHHRAESLLASAEEVGLARASAVERRSTAPPPIARRVRELLGVPSPAAVAKPPAEQATPPAAAAQRLATPPPSSAPELTPPQAAPAADVAPAGEGSDGAKDSTRGADGAVVAALARLQEMKKKYNIQVEQARGEPAAGEPAVVATEPATPAKVEVPKVRIDAVARPKEDSLATARYGAPKPEPLVTPELAASATDAKAEDPSPSPAVSSSPADMQAIKKRLARLREKR